MDGPQDIFLGMPGYGGMTAAASRGFWRASAFPNRILWKYQEGSLLAQNFNELWVTALNANVAGQKLKYFGMQHSDIEPDEFWLDKAIQILERHELDVLGIAAPIKDFWGRTSVALAHPSGDPWRILCRLSTTEVFQLPETFTSKEVGHPVLLNTGLWVCRFGQDWNDKVHFTINDRIVKGPDGKYHSQVEPEDWFFSRLLHEMGLRVGCTRAIGLEHFGGWRFSNRVPFGESYDSGYVPKSILQIDPKIDGYQSIQGYFDFEHVYDQIAAELPEDGTFVEVGCWRGKSLFYMLERLRKSGKNAKVVGVDHFRGSVEDPNLRQMASVEDVSAQCVQNLRASGYPFTIINSPSVEAAGSFANRSLDAIFIDGSHDRDSVIADLKAWLPKLKTGGILAGHDINQRGVKEALESVFPNVPVDVLPRPDELGGVKWGVCWRVRL